MQHPIIRPPVFGEQIWQPIIQLTTGWLLGDIQHFNKRVYTPSSDYGHYPTTHDVISLFISVWRNTEGSSFDHLGYFPWDPQGWGGCGSHTPAMVVWCISEPVLWWLALGTDDLRGWMAPTCGLDKDQQSTPFVITLDGGSWLESSQQLSTPSNSSNLAWNHYGTLFPIQDIEFRILGEKNGHKAFNALLMFLSF